jgi:hypothetical protein
MGLKIENFTDDGIDEEGLRHGGEFLAQNFGGT